MLKLLILSTSILLLGTNVANATCNVPEIEVTKKFIDKGSSFGPVYGNKAGETITEIEIAHQYKSSIIKIKKCLTKVNINLTYIVKIVIKDEFAENTCLVKQITKHENQHKADFINLINELHPVLNLSINENIKNLKTASIKSEITNTLKKYLEIFSKESKIKAEKFHNEAEGAPLDYLRCYSKK